MKLGAIFPQYELGATPETLTRFAQAAEAIGYDYLSYPEHVLATQAFRSPPYRTDMFSENDYWQDPFVAMGFLAAVTSRLKLHTGVLILPQRQTALVARQAADVDILSNGRLVLGVGLGWNYTEYEALGQDFHTRGRRANAQIPMMRRLWEEPLMTTTDGSERMDRAALNPRPKRQIPIWIGGASEAGYRRAAKLGDGFLFPGNLEAFSIGVADQVLQYRREYGLPIEGYGLEMMTSVTDRDTFRGPGPSLDSIRRWRDWGGTHAAVSTTEQGHRTVDDHIAFLAEVYYAVRS